LTTFSPSGISHFCHRVRQRTADYAVATTADGGTMTVDSSRRLDAATCAALRYAEPMEIWLLLLLLPLAGVVVWAWWRVRVSASSSSAKHRGDKRVFETTMGDLRDLRHALRPLQKDRRNHPQD